MTTGTNKRFLFKPLQTHHHTELNFNGGSAQNDVESSMDSRARSSPSYHPHRCSRPRTGKLQKYPSLSSLAILHYLFRSPIEKFVCILIFVCIYATGLLDIQISY